MEVFVVVLVEERCGAASEELVVTRSNPIDQNFALTPTRSSLIHHPPPDTRTPPSDLHHLSFLHPLGAASKFSPSSPVLSTSYPLSSSIHRFLTIILSSSSTTPHSQPSIQHFILVLSSSTLYF
ncbi:hypothetical protein Pmani_013618 [Petrolisthes manimaculis]|uniref:Uncharacterized protein n=1 Tax=Petrolisthes manimaculis TaxID=1843537 RepID=A0AAE1PWW9_9EUCA|nr:hypothetical protein Pmani_013618 [Petrolisthes manimaculis]